MKLHYFVSIQEKKWMNWTFLFLNWSIEPSKLQPLVRVERRWRDKFHFN